MSLQATSSQTIGPYLHIGLTWLITDNLAVPGVSGEKVTIEGRIVDGDGNAVNDAVVEIWQANSHGRYAHPEDTQDKLLESSFKGFGRVMTDSDGVFRLTTIKPGRVPAPDGELQAPHLNVSIFTRGLLKHLITRMYFPDEPANDEDPVLQRVPAERRQTLIATLSDGKSGALKWNVVLRGERETVFFDY
jgi:protocatechuate 3,4-dioxygenase alpha subunit